MKSKRQTITVLANTMANDVEPGDLVMTGELMQVVKRFPTRDDRSRAHTFECVMVRPQCEVCGKRRCHHAFVKEIGWGPQGILKVLTRN